MRKTTIPALLLTLILIFSLTGCQSGGSKPKSEAEKPWPTKPITLICSSTAGGPNDIMSRIAASALEKELGVAVSVVNKPGANTWTAANELLAGPRDGYTFASIAFPGFYSGYLDPSQKRKESIKDFIFLSNLVTDPKTIYIKGDEKRFTDLKSLLEYAKKNDVTIQGGGNAGDVHIAIEKLRLAHPGLKLTIVHFKGAAEGVTAVMGGHVDVGIGYVGNINLHKDGSIKILAVFSKERLKDFMPEIPTYNELGLGGSVLADANRGFVYPKGVDPAIVAKMTKAMEKVFASEEVRQKHIKAGLPIDVVIGDKYKEMSEKDEKDIAKMAPIFGWK